MNIWKGKFGWAMGLAAVLLVAGVGSPAAPNANHRPSATSFEEKTQPQGNLAGKWNIDVTASDGPHKASLDLKVATDGTITGTIGTEYGNCDVTSGSITEDSFRIKFTLPIEGSPTPVVLDGTITGDSIKGTGTVGDGTFDYTGSRQTGS